jgi:2'-5' RNA ligase
METQRIFIAIKIANTEQIQMLFHQLQSDLKGEHIKWVDLKGLHLTLSFLGETDIRKIAMIKNRLLNVSTGIKAFQIQLKALGAFPNEKYPKIIWAGVKVDDVIFNLQRKILEQLEFIVPISDKRFSPHVTLGRIKYGIKNPKFVSEILKSKANWEDEAFLVEEIVLMESQLTGHGAKYKIVDRFELK